MTRWSTPTAIALSSARPLLPVYPSRLHAHTTHFTSRPVTSSAPVHRARPLHSSLALHRPSTPQLSSPLPSSLPLSPSTSPLPSPPSPPSSAPPVLHFLFVLEYVGSSFHGSSGVSSRYRTVESVLTSALTKATRSSPLSLVFAGRTDAAVHAVGQVAHCSIAPPPSHAFSAELLRYRVNQAIYHAGAHRCLHVVTAHRVQPSFHARFSALARVYQYRILTGEPLLFERGRSWHLPHHLHVEAMREAASLLCGTHDFASLVSHRSTDRRSTVRTISSLTVSVTSPRGGSELMELKFTAPSFLRRQVRNVVAVLVEVGRGG